MSSSVAKTADELASQLRRDINSLADENRGARARALKNLAQALLPAQRSSSSGLGGLGLGLGSKKKNKKKKGPKKPKKAVVTEYFNSHLVEPLANALADPVENCREEACNLLIRLVETGTLRDAFPAFRASLPILVKRVGKYPFDEAAEEVRLLMVQLLQAFLKAKSCRKAKTKVDIDAVNQDQHSSSGAGVTAAPSGDDEAEEADASVDVSAKKIAKRPSPLEPYIGEICQVLGACLRDNFPDVKKATAAAINEVTQLFSQHMHLHLGVLLDPLLGNILHVQHRVRRTSLISLGKIVLCGSGELPKVFREKIIPHLYKVLDDHTPSVRKEQVDVLAAWLSARRVCLHCDRELEATIFSILLGAVGDETEEVAQHAIARIEDVAKEWWSSDNVGSVGDESDIGNEPSAAASENGFSLTDSTVPKPFQVVPSAAAQRLVCSLLPAVLPPVLHALSDWKVSRRLATVSMLQALFVFAHRDLTASLPEVLSAMVLQVCDDEKSIAEAVSNCGETLGGCVDPEAILSVLLPWIRCEFKEGVPVQAQKNSLLMLASCVDGMPDGAVIPHLEAIAKTLCHQAVTNSEDNDVQFQVTEVVLSVLDKAGQLDAQDRVKKGEQFFFDLLRTLLNLVALGDDGVRAQALEGIESLAEILELESPQDLYRQHFDQLLRIATEGFEQWKTRTSPGFGFFESLLRQCDPTIVARCIDEDFMSVLAQTCDPSKDPTLRMEVLALIESLVSGQVGGAKGPRDASAESVSSIATAFQKQGEVVLMRILVPNLVWKVGRVEGTIRKLSVACLISVLKHGAVSTDQLVRCLGDVVPALTSTMSDDYDTPMRHLSCVAMQRLLELVKGRVGDSFASDLYPELLKRLDDSSDDVRKAIAPCLGAFFRVADKSSYGTTLREYTLDMLLVHLDDQDVTIQNAIFEVLNVMMDSLDDTFLDLMAKKAAAARAQHRSPKYCDKLLATVESKQGHVEGAD